MCSMHRRSGQASGIMPTSGIYGGKTTFASAPSLSIPLSLSTSPLLAVSLSFSLLLFLLHTHSLTIFIFVSLSRSLCSYLVLHLFLSRSLTLPLDLCPLSLVRCGAQVSSTAASLAFHYWCSMECIGLSQHLRTSHEVRRIGP